MRRRRVLAALASTSLGGCLRLEGGSGTATTSRTLAERDEPDASETTTPPGLMASAEMTEEIGSRTGGEVTVRISNNGATAFDGEVLLLFDREVQSAKSVEVPAGAEATTVVSVGALDVGERQVSVEVRSADRREVVFDQSLGTTANPVTLQWGKRYTPSDGSRGRTYICSRISVESPNGTLGSYNIGIDHDGIDIISGMYPVNRNRRENSVRWFGEGDRGTVIWFEEVDLRVATTLRLQGHLPETIDSTPVVCRMGGMDVAEVTWERDGEHTIPLTLFE